MEEYISSSEKNNIDVLLTYGWVRSTYSALRNLVRHGLNTAVSDHSPFGMCQWSHYPVFSFKYPDPCKNENDFINKISTFVREKNVKILIPSHDETTIIARDLNSFPSSCTIPIPEVQLLDFANDKSLMQEFALEHGISTAKRINYGSIPDLVGKLNNNIHNKLVIRLRKGNSAKGVFYADNHQNCLMIIEDLVRKYSISPDRLPVIQEFVQGEGWGVSCLYWQGERIAHFTHRRLREKTETGGTSTLREHQPNKLLEDMAFKLLDKLKWHGLAMVEFKYNPQTSQAWFIEINPRLWGSIHLAISAGVEFPWLLYLCATEGPEAAKTYHKGKNIRYPWKSRWYLGDCIVAMNKLSKGKIFESLKLLSPGGTDTYDDFDIKDPGASFGEALYYLYNFLKHRSVNPVSEGMIG